MRMKSEPQEQRLGLKPKRLTHAMYQAHFKAWERSGLNKAAFCESQGLSKKGFYSWLRRCKEKEKTMMRVSAFSKAVLSGRGSTKNDEEISIQMRLPNHAEIFFLLGRTDLVGLIQELCDATTIIR